MLATAPARAEVRSPSSSVSPARLAANRLNAQKSTGPRTAEGKGRSSQNALKHGLCSGAAVLPGECAEAFDAFGRELDEELRPRGSAQRMLFEQIHNLAWKLRRVPNAERKLFELETERLSRPRGGHVDPADVLAHSFADHEKRNPFEALARYERSMQNMLLRLISRLKQHQKEQGCETNPPKPVPRRPAPVGAAPASGGAQQPSSLQNEPTATARNPSADGRSSEDNAMMIQELDHSERRDDGRGAGGT